MCLEALRAHIPILVDEVYGIVYGEVYGFRKLSVAKVYSYSMHV